MFFGKRFSGHHGDPFSGLDILVLSIIKNYDGISGYDIIPVINEKFKDLWRASPGTIYPLLNRLNRNSFVSVEDVNDSKNRKKKLYRITKSGKERLKEVLRDNFELSINTLGDFIRTIVQTWVPDEERINKAMLCFPFDCAADHPKMDKTDYSLPNIERLKRIIKELEFSKLKLSGRLNEIDRRIENHKTLLTELKMKREKNMKIIEIVDDEEYENF